MFVNRSKLRGQISEKGIKVKNLIKKLRLSRTAYYSKMKGKTDFTENEISILKSIFGKVIFFD